MKINPPLPPSSQYHPCSKPKAILPSPTKIVSQQRRHLRVLKISIPVKCETPTLHIYPERPPLCGLDYSREGKETCGW